jgi:hypothetical protein
LRTIELQPVDLGKIRVCSNEQDNSLFQFIKEQAGKDYIAERRPPNSIHGSSFWDDCLVQFAFNISSTPPTDRVFNVSNYLAADAGDATHTDFQAILAKIGMPVEIPYWDVNPVFQAVGRDAGKLKPAIEVSLWDYYRFNSVERELYTAMGFVIPGDEYLENLKDYYRLGMRLDSILKKRGTYNRCFICEIKTAKEKIFKEIVSYLDKYEKGVPDLKMPVKLQHYILQLQMQMYFTPDPYTGAPMEWGCVYLVNRNDESKVKEIYVQFDPRVAEAYLPLIRQKKELWDLMESDEYEYEIGADGSMFLPSGEVLEPNPTENNCGFCDWYSLCKSPNKKPFFGNNAFKFAKARINKQDINEEVGAFDALIANFEERGWI